jgi:O-antigen/teichoic acid export membrane protein
MKSLRESLITGSVWTLGSVGAGQVLKLVRSMVLSRLLVPDAFGLMAIVWAILFCLDLLSDVGLAPGIVRSPHGDDQSFLNTAWTMKVIRGGVLCAIACAIGYPTALFYQKPALAALIPVAGLSILIEGFSSTKTYSCRRNMMFARITIFELTTEVISTLATVTWAWVQPSVWALVGGALIGRTAHLIGSHTLLPGQRNKLQWNSASFHELVTFGKWVLLSSAIYLLYAQGDRLILGKYLDMRMFGVYTIAAALSEAVSGVASKMTAVVFFPAMGKALLSDRNRYREVIYRIRLGMDSLMIVPISMLLMLSPVVVKILYDVRYQEAGWMLQILCIRLLMISMLIGGEASLSAMGYSRFGVTQNICRALWIFIGIPLCWHLYGLVGVVWVVALTELPVFFVIWPGMKKHDLLSVRHELRSFIFIAIGLLAGWSLLFLIHKISRL